MIEPVADAGCADAFRRIGHYAGGSDLEENWGSAGLKLCETVNRAQAVEERQRRLYTNRDRRGMERGRRDRAGRRTHPGADTRGVHAGVVVCGVQDLMRKGAAGGRPQHEEDGHRQSAGNRPEQRSDHQSALPRDLKRIITGRAGRCQIQNPSPFLCRHRFARYHACAAAWLKRDLSVAFM